MTSKASTWVINAQIGEHGECWWPRTGTLKERLWTQFLGSARQFATQEEADALAVLIQLSCGPLVRQIKVVKLERR